MSYVDYLNVSNYFCGIGIDETIKKIRECNNEWMMFMLILLLIEKESKLAKIYLDQSDYHYNNKKELIKNAIDKLCKLKNVSCWYENNCFGFENDPKHIIFFQWGNSQVSWHTTLNKSQIELIPMIKGKFDGLVDSNFKKIESEIYKFLFLNK